MQQPGLVAPIIPLRTVVIAAIDPSSASKQVLPNAIAAAKSPGVELHIVHVVDPAPLTMLSVALADLLRPGRAFLEDAVEQAARQTSSKIYGHLSVGAAAEVILELASALAADLVIVGTSGKNVLQRMVLGSVSRHVSNEARCGVLVARTKDWARPATEPEKLRSMP